MPPIISTGSATSSVTITVPIAHRKHNILCCVFDDMGIEQCRKYDSIWGAAGYTGTETDLFTKGVYANTPNLDAFHATAVQFIQARSQPLCSPTRAGLYTGRRGRRTGIGGIVSVDRAVGGVSNKCHQLGYDVSTPGTGSYVSRREYTIAEIARAAGYNSAIFGKWHLSLWGGTDAGVHENNTDESGTLPNGTPYTAKGYASLDDVGKWDHWFCGLRNVSNKPQPFNGASPAGTYGVPNFQGQDGGWYGREKGDAQSTLYNGSSNYLEKIKVQKALAWMNDPANQPWICFVTFHLVHSPFHDPRPAGYTIRSVYTNQFNNPDTDIAGWALQGAMREALDVEFGNLLNGLDSGIKARTNIFVTSDNGTEPGMMKGVRDLYDNVGNPTANEFLDTIDLSKGTVYNLGSWVPLWVAGPSVVGAPRTSSIPVEVHTDLFATFRNLMHTSYSATAGGQPMDGVSILPALRSSLHGITAHPKKAHLVEKFKPNGDADEVMDQGLTNPSDMQHDRAYQRYLRSEDGFSGNAAGLYALIRKLNTSTGDTTEEFYRMATGAGSPAGSDWTQQDDLIADSNFADQLAICREELDAIEAQG